MNATPVPSATASQTQAEAPTPAPAEAPAQAPVVEEAARTWPGIPVLLLGLLLCLGSVAATISGAIKVNAAGHDGLVPVVIVAGCLVHVASYFIFGGLRLLQPKQAYVLTLFGQYHGSLRGPGFFFVNPFATPTAPQGDSLAPAPRTAGGKPEDASTAAAAREAKRKTISLRTRTLSNDKMKINDELGNPVEIGIVVTWQVVDTARAIFNVDDYESYLSIQCDASLRNVVRLYPYDSADQQARSLKGSSQEIADEIQAAIQEKVDAAGIEVLEARITHLAYAPEIAAAMLQRQQASAVVDARSLIVKGAVGMVREALDQLAQESIVDLDDERKAQMVSNLLVVLCANRDTQPVVNSGTLY